MSSLDSSSHDFVQVIFMCNFRFKTAAILRLYHWLFFHFFSQENKIVTAAIILYKDDKLDEEDMQ